MGPPQTWFPKKIGQITRCRPVGQRQAQPSSGWVPHRARRTHGGFVLKRRLPAYSTSHGPPASSRRASPAEGRSVWDSVVSREAAGQSFGAMTVAAMSGAPLAGTAVSGTGSRQTIAGVGIGSRRRLPRNSYGRKSAKNTGADKCRSWWGYWVSSHPTSMKSMNRPAASLKRICV